MPTIVDRTRAVGSPAYEGFSLRQPPHPCVGPQPCGRPCAGAPRDPTPRAAAAPRRRTRGRSPGEPRGEGRGAAREPARAQTRRASITGIGTRARSRRRFRPSCSRLAACDTTNAGLEGSSKLAKNSPENRPDSLTSFRATNLRCVRQRRSPCKCTRSTESCSAPERIRTSDLRFRRPTLYPAELRAQGRRSMLAASGEGGIRTRDGAFRPILA
jgi:hypothetical protein